MDKKINLYSNTGCGRCALLKKWLDMKKIPYNELNISEDNDAREKLMSNGLRQLPQLEIEDKFITFEEYNDILEHI